MDGRAPQPQPTVSSPEDPTPRPPSASRRQAVFFWSVIAAGFSADAAFLVLDQAAPSYHAIAMLYAVPVIGALWLRSARSAVALAIIGSMCAFAGFLMSSVTPDLTLAEAALYRLSAVLVLWSVALAAVRQQAARSIAEHSETATHHQAALHQAILDTAPDAMVVIDPDGIVKSFSRSAEALFGYDAAEVVGRNVKLLMPTGHRESHDGYLQRYLRTGERRIIGIGRVVEARTRDGRVFPIELSVGEARVAQHRVFIAFIRDLSARQRIEEELRQAQKMEAVGQLTGGIAHDFNNLLTVIVGNLELLDMRRDRVDEVALAEALAAAELGAQLTSQLLAFGRRQPLDPRNTDLVALVEDVAGLLRRSLGDHVALTVDVRGRPGRAVVDASQLKNALINLAINARDAMPGGGRLVVSVADTEIDDAYAESFPEVRLGRYVAISVSDTGVGMTSEVRERAFEPFFTTKPQGSGTGMGLAMVYGFAKQSGGHAQIDSAPGRGTRVTLFLPREEEPAAAAGLIAGAGMAGSGRGETILVVEDDARVRRVVVARLAALGYDLVAAESGPHALAALDDAPGIDLLFTDVVMAGGMSGFDLAREVRNVRPGMRILFTSGYAAPDDVARERVGRSLDRHFLRKPYSREQLAQAVRAALDEPAASAPRG